MAINLKKYGNLAEMYAAMDTAKLKEVLKQQQLMAAGYANKRTVAIVLKDSLERYLSLCSTTECLGYALHEIEEDLESLEAHRSFTAASIKLIKALIEFKSGE